MNTSKRNTSISSASPRSHASRRRPPTRGPPSHRSRRVARPPPAARLEINKSINTHHVLPLKELLGHDRGQTTDKVPLSVNHNNLRSHRAIRRGVVVSHTSSRLRIVTLFVHRRMIRPMRWARRRERAMSPSWTPSGGVKMVGSIARRRARSMAVVPCPSYSDVASQRGGVGRATKAFPTKLVAPHQCKTTSRKSDKYCVLI